MFLDGLSVFGDASRIWFDVVNPTPQTSKCGWFQSNPIRPISSKSLGWFYTALLNGYGSTS